MASRPAIRRNSFASASLKVDNAILGCDNAVAFYRTAAIEFLLGAAEMAK